MEDGAEDSPGRDLRVLAGIVQASLAWRKSKTLLR